AGGRPPPRGECGTLGRFRLGCRPHPRPGTAADALEGPDQPRAHRRAGRPRKPRRGARRRGAVACRRRRWRPADRRVPAPARTPGQHRDRLRGRDPAWPLRRVRRGPRRLPAAVASRGLRRQRRRAGGPGVRHGGAAALHPATPAAAVGTGPAVRGRAIPRCLARSARCRRTGRAAGPGHGRMTAAITAGELFEQLRERLELRWIAGQEGAAHRLESVETVARRPSLAGYLNAIYPNKVQILGTEELTWLDGLDSRLRWETIQKIMHFNPLALVISKDQPCPEDLRIAAEETDTPLWSSPKRGHELLNHLQYHLARTLAPRVTLHGVFMEIY